MQGIPRRLRLSGAPMREDAGFMLIEVIVSAVLLVVLALATFKLIDGSQNLAAQDRSKSIASALAESNLDQMRQSRFSTVSTTAMNVTRTVPSDGRNYTVTSLAVWTSSQGESSSCTTSTSGNPGQYLRLTSTVTWPGMSIQPVTADTVLAPRPGEVAVSTGAFMFKFQNVAGAALQGVSVTMAGQTLVSSSAGCVIFAGVTPGTYSTTYSKGGYVATSFASGSAQTTGTYSATVTKGNTSGKTLLLDQPATITPVTFKVDDGTGTTTSTWHSYSVSSNMGSDFLGVYPSTPSSTDVGSYTSSAQLFPFSAGYQVYAGRCDGNNPLVYNSGFSGSGVLAASAVRPAPGGTAAATAFLRRISVSVSNATNRPLTLYATPLSTGTMANCTGTAREVATSPVGTPPGTAAFTVFDDVPYGLYTLCVSTGGKSYNFPGTYNNTPSGTTGTNAPTTSTPTVAYSTTTFGGTGC